MAQNRLHSQEPARQLFGLNERDRAIRLHLQNRLTDIQYRRVVLYYGLDGGKPMSQREVAEAEGVHRKTLYDSLEQVHEKLQNDSHLWMLWLLRKDFTPGERGHSERTEAVTEEEMLELMTKRGGRILDSRDGSIRWDSDRFHPASPYDVEVDSLNEAYDNHEITRLEWQVGLVMARAEDEHPDGTERARTDLRQKLEWAFGGRALGVLTKSECSLRVSRALRTYVREG